MGGWPFDERAREAGIGAETEPSVPIPFRSFAKAEGGIRSEVYLGR